jgi:type IV pilus assembly protein PilW
MKYHEITVPMRRAGGFSLVELMVALTLGLLLSAVTINTYVSSKNAYTRIEQLSSIQQSVRIAFEHLSGDARMVGHMGCYTGLPTSDTGATPFNSAIATTPVSLATNYALGVEGYEYANATVGAYTLSSNAPADTLTATEWSVNTSLGGVNTIPISTIAGAGNGLTPGSDVLVIRTIAGRPVRLSASAVFTDSIINVENLSGGTCSSGTAKVSGLCANSHGLAANCTNASVFQVSSIAGQALTLTGALGNVGVAGTYATDATEVFPLQTIVYYVKRSAKGNATSLYRRIFDGDNAAGLEQELIEGVENLQILYGVDTTVPDTDGIVDSYVAAPAVTDWSRVVTVRMGLIVRSATRVEGDVSLPTTGIVNGVTVTYPTAGVRFDRRVFTTTVAVRNRIAYFGAVP